MHLTMSKFKKSTPGPSCPHLCLNPTLYPKCHAHQEPKETVVAKAGESLLPHADPFKGTKPFQVALSWSGDGRPLCRFPRRWLRCCYHRNYCYHLLFITPWQERKGGHCVLMEKETRRAGFSQDERSILRWDPGGLNGIYNKMSNSQSKWIRDMSVYVCCCLCWQSWGESSGA